MLPMTSREAFFAPIHVDFLGRISESWLGLSASEVTRCRKILSLLCMDTVMCTRGPVANFRVCFNRLNTPFYTAMLGTAT